MDLACSTPPSSMAVSCSYERHPHRSSLSHAPCCPLPLAFQNPSPFCPRHLLFPRMFSDSHPFSILSQRLRHLPPGAVRKNGPALHTEEELSAAERRDLLEDLLRSSQLTDPRESSADSALSHEDRIHETDEIGVHEPGLNLHWWRERLGSLSNPRVRGILLLNVLTFLYGA